MKKVFITRQLNPESPFDKILSGKGYKVIGRSLLKFTAVPFNRIPEVDWLFFYSQNGVRFFYQQIATGNTELPFRKATAQILNRLKLAAIGPATAALTAAMHRPVDFMGDGNAESTAHAFLKVAAGQRVLFPRARQSRRSVQQLIDHQVKTFDLVVYDNIPRLNPPLPEADILVFTSPLNAKAYFSKKKWRAEQRIVAIGQTTLDALKTLGIDEVTLAEEPSEKSLAAAVIACSGEL